MGSSDFLLVNTLSKKSKLYKKAHRLAALAFGNSSPSPDFAFGKNLGLKKIK